jgi:oxygen-independent coproporphyrinogen-3 oxidase
MHLYFHIPFCKQACHYCDFYFSTNKNLKSQIVESICKEIAIQKDYLKNKKIQTIYFGGGTPSLLTQNELNSIFETLSIYYDLSNLKEITFEANPDDVSKENIEIWKEFGINRISLGIQTFNDAILKFMNRPHTGLEAKNAVFELQSSGIENISMDLIYSIFNMDGIESERTLHSDLGITLDFNLPHISAYSLTIEEKTVFGNWAKKDKIIPLDEDSSASQYEILVSTLTDSGYEQYEVSNFAKNNQYAIHNSSYWQNQEYLGFGPSAHSYNLQSRQANIANNTKYIKCIENNTPFFEIENLSAIEKANDMILCGLRTKWGLDIKNISQIIGDFSPTTWDKIEYYRNNGQIELKDDTITITKSGRIFSDKIASDLFFE